jgi:hypothetical protein
VKDARTRHVRRYAIATAIVLAVISGLVEVVVGIKLPVVGLSILLPTIVVALISLCFLVLGTAILFRVKTALLTFIVLSVSIGLATTWWTYAFSWPSAMALDSSATPSALAALSVAPQIATKCVIRTTGSVGPLRAPYQRCATRAGSTVFYSAMANGQVIDPSRGLVFDEGPASNLSDHCVRHLVGDWYAVSGNPDGLTGYSECFGGG